jgi:hypothetical protein
MPYRFTDFQYMYETDPGALAQRIIDTFQEAHGDLERTFQLLGVTHQTYYNYVRKLGIKETMRSLRDVYAERLRRKRRPATSVEAPRRRFRPVLG